LSGDIRISRDLSLPLKAAIWTFADLGIKDSGKTYDAGDLAEEFLKNGVPILVLDGMGIWLGLRIGADKKGRPDPEKPGMPVVVFGGDHKDLPIPTRFLLDR
jgi:DNA helicase HerA-like ATPase